MKYASSIAFCAVLALGAAIYVAGLATRTDIAGATSAVAAAPAAAPAEPKSAGPPPLRCCGQRCTPRYSPD